MIALSKTFQELTLSLSMITTDRRFWPLFWTQFLGAANDNLFKNALVILITYKNVELMGLDAKTLVAAAGAIFILPYVTFSATAGQIADHFDKSLVVKATKFTELIIMVIASIGFMTSNYMLLLFTLFLMGAQSAFFSPVKFGSLPEILNKDEITLGNAFIGAGTFVAILVGTILGGLSAANENAAHITSAGIICAAIVGILTAFKQRKIGVEHTGVKIDYTFVKPTFQILAQSIREKKVFHAIMGISWFWFFGACILSLLPEICKTIFLGNQLVGTMLLAIFTIGMGTGAFVCNKLSEKRVEVGMVPLAAVGMTIFLLDLYYVTNSWQSSFTELVGPLEFLSAPGSLRAVIDLFIVTTFGGMYIIPQQAYLQTNAKPEFLARMIAANNIWNAIFMVAAGIMLMILHGMALSLPKILALLAIGNIIYAFVCYLFYVKYMWRFLASMATKLFYKLDIDGIENLPQEGAVIVASNHVSFVDWLFIMAVSPRPVHWVIDHVYYNRPLFKTLFKHAELIPIATRKESEGLMKDAFSHIHKKLDEKSCVGIFPEGYVTRSGAPGRFQPGIKKIVDHTGATVVPIVINGAWGSYFTHDGGLFKGISFFQRRKIHLTILPSICAGDFCYKDLEGLIVDRYQGPKDKLESVDNHAR